MRRLVAVLLLAWCGCGRTDSGLRPFSVDVIAIGSKPLVKGETFKAEATWSPPYDAYVIGWALYVKTPGATVTLMGTDLTILAREAGGSDAIRPQFVSTGAGYSVPKQRSLTLRLDGTNESGLGHTHRTMALIYFVQAGR